MRNPYITGPYVSGNRHYGRSDLIERLLTHDARAHWVTGNRRIGKTSLLRQLESIALAGERMVPIWWDMQGCNSFASLGGYLADALQERLSLLLKIGFPRSMAREENALELLPVLRRSAARAGREVLLLCDETEVLISLARSEPETAQRLHSALTGGDGLRVVAVSTRAIHRMEEVCRAWPTSPFLAGFDMARSLGSLDAESARALVIQAQAPDQVMAAPEVVNRICELTNNHPYLLQLLCSRLFQPDGHLRPVTDQDLSVDSLLIGFLRNDFGLLSEVERRIVRGVHEHPGLDEVALADALGENLDELRCWVGDLQPLGFLRRRDSTLVIGNRFLANWLTLERRQTGRQPAAEPAAASAPESLDREVLVAQLNAKRNRLVELELVRAREFMAVAPPVLAEIRETEERIAHILHQLNEAAA